MIDWHYLRTPNVICIIDERQSIPVCFLNVKSGKYTFKEQTILLYDILFHGDLLVNGPSLNWSIRRKQKAMIICKFQLKFAVCRHECKSKKSALFKIKNIAARSVLKRKQRTTVSLFHF